MKKQILLTTLLLCATINLSFAQGTFKVIAASGTNTKNSAALKIGTQILSSDNITVSPKSYLALSYSNGGTVQISTAGTYNAKTLETKLLATTKTSSQKYADFIIGEVVKSGDANIHKNPYAYQNVTGSVERATNIEGQVHITVLLPEKIEFIHDRYTFQWLKTKGVKTYIVEIEDSFGQVVKTITTKDTSATLDFTIPELKEQDLIIVRVTTKDKKISKKNFSFRKPDDENLHKKALAFKKGLGTDIDTDAQKQVDMAVFLEENMLILDAKQSYEKAIALEHTNEIFTIAYNQFLLRHKLGMITEKELKAKNED